MEKIMTNFGYELLRARGIAMHEDDLLFLCIKTEERMKNKSYKSEKSKNSAYKRIFFAFFDEHKAILRYEEKKKAKAEDKKKTSIVNVGDTVYIICKYLVNEYSPYILICGQITSIEHGQFVVYANGTWRFSQEDIGKYVFTTREEAQSNYRKRNQ